ncbi:unnamed protein product [Ixodes persulcatus]
MKPKLIKPIGSFKNCANRKFEKKNIQLTNPLKGSIIKLRRKFLGHGKAIKFELLISHLAENYSSEKHCPSNFRYKLKKKKSFSVDNWNACLTLWIGREVMDIHRAPKLPSFYTLSVGTNWPRGNPTLCSFIDKGANSF